MTSSGRDNDKGRIMAVYTEQLQQLYIAYFKRPADVAGLAFWETAAAGRGVEALLPSFTQSAEYASLYQGLSNQQVVNTMYQNLFGRDAESAGLAFWVQALESGALTLETLPLSLIRDASADDVRALAHKTTAATAFTGALDTAAEAEAYSGAAAFDIARAWLATITEEPASATAAATAMSSVLSNAVDAGNGITHGKVVDGYIAGATVFADANGNLTWDEGEARTVTDAQGNFTLADAQGSLVATGGTDIATNLAFTGMMIAPEGATIINPITTLQETLIRQGQSTDQAQATISTAFGISVANLDVDQRDPLEAAFRPGASPADLASAVQWQAAAAKIQNLLVATSQALTGAVPGMSGTAASMAAAQALAEVVRNDADGVVSLSDTAVLTQVLTGAAEVAGANQQQTAALADIASGFSAIIAATANAIDAISANTSMSAGLAQARILQVETAAQGTVANAIQAAAASGDITQAAQQFTGSQLTSVILSTKIGDVVPGAAPDSAIIDIVNGTEPGPEPEPQPDTTPPAAPTGLALAAADDTGISSNDGVTKNTSGLTINGNAEPGSTVDLYLDLGEGNLELVGTTEAIGGRFSIDVDLAEGTHKLVAKATDAAANTGPTSSPVTITVDTTGPAELQARSLLNYSATYLSSSYGDLVASGNNLVQVGGTNNFGTRLAFDNPDDAFASIDVSAVFTNGLKLGDMTYSGTNGLLVGINGYMTLGVGNSSYDAAGIPGYTESPMIAAQFDDIDTGKSVSISPGGTSTGSNGVYYHVDTDTKIVTLTWDDVAPYAAVDSSIPGNNYAQGNAFQIRLHQIQGSDFVIEMRYENMSWINGNSGLPTAGWTAGDGINYGEVQGSGTVDMLNVESTSNIGQNGVYLWEVKSGTVTENLIDVNDVTGKIAFELSATDQTAGDVLTYALGANADSRFSLVNGNQIVVADNAQFNLDDEATITLPVTVTDKAGNMQQRDIVLTLFTSQDSTAPTLTSTSPADDATGVAVDANIVLTFSEAVQAGSGNIRLVQDDVEDVNIDIPIDSNQVVFNGNTVTINPTANLVAGANYHIEIGNGVIKDIADNAYAGISGDGTLNFAVVPQTDTTAPTLQALLPGNQSFASPDTDLVMRFTEEIKAGSGVIELWAGNGADGSRIDTIDVTDLSQVSFDGATMTIDPDESLDDLAGGQSQIYVTMGSGVVVDLIGNPYAGINDAGTFTFNISPP